MAGTSPYSAVDDLLLGDIPIGVGANAQKYVQDAADEMDSSLGFLYETPIDYSASPRHVGLLLKRINNHLASGRLILAVAAGSEDSLVHAYGLMLIREAIEALYRITSGSIILEGVPQAGGDEESTGPGIKNLDDYSGVEAFYDIVMAPGIFQPPPWWNPGAMPNGT